MAGYAPAGRLLLVPTWYTTADEVLSVSKEAYKCLSCASTPFATSTV